MSQKISDLFVEQGAKHDDDRSADAGMTQDDAFFNRGDSDMGYAVAYQCPGRFHRAMTVGVGFDYRHHAATGGEKTSKLSQIVGQGGQINGCGGGEECRRSGHA